MLSSTNNYNGYTFLSSIDVDSVNVGDPGYYDRHYIVNIKGRKHFNVLPALVQLNNHLSRKDRVATQEFKAGFCDVIEFVLLNTDNYDGFNFLNNPRNESRGSGHSEYYDRVYTMKSNGI